MFTGASTGDKLDGEFARANAIKFRTPYQSNKDLRAALNAHQAQYFDLHLSELAQSLRYGFLGKIDVAIVEAADVTEDGEIVPTSGVGILPTICRMADRIIVELNCRHPKEIRGMHDIYEPADPPLRREIPIYTPSDRIGNDCVKVDPAKIVGVVRTDEPNEGGKFSPLDDVTMAIGKNVADFLVSEIKAGRLPKEFVPLQSGVGNVANAVLGCMGANESIPAFNVYTEVIQDAVIELMKQGRVKFASGCSLSVSNEVIREIYANLDFFKDKILLRPQEISNNPEVARRLGLIAINTALEADIFGNINSTHVSGTRMMNGIGGSGDFTRSAMLSIFTTPSTAKDRNRPFDDFPLEECTYGTPYYITVEELHKIYGTNLMRHPQLAVQRDIFVFQCLIGCRVGDLLKMTKSNLIDGAIEYIPRKTKEGRPLTVRVPLNQTAKEIAARYKSQDGDKLLPFISEQKYNLAIKRIFKAAGLKRLVTDRKSTRLNSSHTDISRMPSSA